MRTVGYAQAAHSQLLMSALTNAVMAWSRLEFALTTVTMETTRLEMAVLTAKLKLAGHAQEVVLSHLTLAKKSAVTASSLEETNVMTRTQ